MSLIRRNEPIGWQRWWLILRLLIDQILMILDMPTLDNTLEIRLARLRRIYYENPKANISYRRVRDVLRGHVAKEYYAYYERLLSVERATKHATQKLHAGARANELFHQVQRLGDKIARLIEELQDLDEIMRLYAGNNLQETENITKLRDTLRQRIDEALEIQSGIPARMITLGTSRAERGIDRLQERLQRLALRLDDIAETYDEMDETAEVSDLSEFAHLSNTDE